MKNVRFLIAGSDGKGASGYSVLSAGKPTAAGPGVLRSRHHDAKSQNCDQAIHNRFPCSLCVSRPDPRLTLIASFSVSRSI